MKASNDKPPFSIFEESKDSEIAETDTPNYLPASLVMGIAKRSPGNMALKFPPALKCFPRFFSALNFFPDAQMFPQIFIRRSNFFLALKCFPRFLFGAQFFSRRSNVFPNFLLHDHPSSCNQRRKASAHSSNTSGLSNIRQQCKLDSCAHVVINVEDDGVALNRSQILLKMYRRRQRRQERHPLGELARQSGLSSSSRSANARGKRRFERLENFFVCPPCIRR